MQEHPGGSAAVNGEEKGADPEKTTTNKALQKKLMAREMISEVKEL